MGNFAMIERTVGGLHSHIFRLLEGIDGGHRSSVLDIGCGSGAWLNRIEVLGFNKKVGVDYVQPEPIEGLDLRQYDINRDIPANLGKFDVVSCIEVIEHIENIGNLLDLIKNTLDQRGVAIISTPNIESLRARTRALVTGKIPSFDNKSDPTHLFPILHDSLQKMLHRRGLTIAHVHQYPSRKFGSLVFGRPVTWIANALRVIFPDNLYGDNTIYFIMHR
jgi:2-polyprenyl-3-methyl-5-hydroxy-6-metoxy-1,4-benzoquinol methylase